MQWKINVEFILLFGSSKTNNTNKTYINFCLVFGSSSASMSITQIIFLRHAHLDRMSEFRYKWTQTYINIRRARGKIQHFNHNFLAFRAPSSSINQNKKPFYSIMQLMYWHLASTSHKPIDNLFMDGFLKRHFNWQIVFLIWITSTLFNISILQVYSYFNRNWIKVMKFTFNSNSLYMRAKSPQIEWRTQDFLHAFRYFVGTFFPTRFLTVPAELYPFFGYDNGEIFFKLWLKAVESIRKYHVNVLNYYYWIHLKLLIFWNECKNMRKNARSARIFWSM